MFADLDLSTSYTVNYSFTLVPSTGPSVPITGSTTFTSGTSSTPTVVASGTFSTPLAGTYTISAGGHTDQFDVAGVTITHGLELDCDLNPSFNLEINWANLSGGWSAELLWDRRW